MYKTIIEPRVSETDGVGHINNTTIPAWLEAGRNPLIKLSCHFDQVWDKESHSLPHRRRNQW